MPKELTIYPKKKDNKINMIGRKFGRDITIKTYTKHGLYQTPEYHTWEAMIQRCANPKNPGYCNYGKRGITVCKCWLKFENFFADMGIRPKGLTIERQDNNKGYYKKNCKWGTRTEQTINQRIRKDNKTGVKGIWWDKLRKKYRVYIGIKNKVKHIGLFPTIETAKTARLEAEQKYWK